MLWNETTKGPKRAKWVVGHSEEEGRMDHSPLWTVPSRPLSRMICVPLFGSLDQTNLGVQPFGQKSCDKETNPSPM